MANQLDPQLLEYFGAPSTQATGHLYGDSHYSLWQESPAQNSHIPVPTEPSLAPFASAPSSQPGIDNRWTWDSSHVNTLDTAGGDCDTFFDESTGY
ncbi:hypothetical protein BJX63DRAFT_417139 [Aspergillus granulosus]|uniref:Uncharacterized protein n=1 Tax=Aspergillus granulosus TaxID=176169 RepID=A0ABR4GR54_9EURO